MSDTSYHVGTSAAPMRSLDGQITLRVWFPGGIVDMPLSQGEADVVGTFLIGYAALAGKGKSNV